MVDPAMDELNKFLFQLAMREKWEEIITKYKEDVRAHTAQIIKSGDTALHIAVSSGKTDVVKSLVEAIVNKDSEERGLKVKNERGEMALHLAATQGNVDMCACLAKDSSLIGERNKETETPLFLAALHGKKQAFLCLQGRCSQLTDKGLPFCRKSKDGQTALHVAIAGEYLDLAFQILNLHTSLADSRNEIGITPLHVLASKPHIFKSGTHITFYQSIIYYSTFVDPLVFEKPDEPQREIGTQDPKTSARVDRKMWKSNVTSAVGRANVLWWPFKNASDLEDSSHIEKNPMAERFPQNYGTCIYFIDLLKGAVGGVKLLGATDPIEGTRARVGNKIFPPSYDTLFDFMRLVSKAMLVILGLGSMEIRKVQAKREKNVWAIQVMNAIIEIGEFKAYESTGRNPNNLEQAAIAHRDIDDSSPYKLEEKPQQNKQKDETPMYVVQNKGVSEMVGKVLGLFPTGKEKNIDTEKIVLMATEKPEILDFESKHTSFLTAAKNGITEMVEKILEKFPVAIQDMDAEDKNVVLLAVENRQPHIYRFLLTKKMWRENIFRHVDVNGNSALHLAATLGSYKPWLIPGAALQMQWELKWYQFVKNSMEPHFFVRYNKQNKTPKEVFTDTHKDLVKNGGEWLTNTSESCSVVAALIATVAFATSATVPGGVKADLGTPTLEKHPAFNVFAISSLVALCFSVTSVVMFLAILTSRYQEKDFARDLPRKLLFGLSSLFISIAAILISFCAGHFFVLRDELKYAAFPVYAVTCLPVTFFAIMQFPLYFDLIRAAFKKVPQRSYIVVPP